MRNRLLIVIAIALALPATRIAPAFAHWAAPESIAVSQVGALTFGALMQLGLSRVSDLIRDAQEAGRVVAINAAVQAQSVIVTAQVAYEESMKKTFAELNESERKVYTDIQNMVTQLAAGTDESLSNAMKKAQLITNTLPFRAKHPQLASFTPPYALPRQESYRVRFDGNFPYAFDAATLPVAVLGAAKHPATLYDNLGISFDIPAKDIGDVAGDHIARKTVEIDIPWDASKWYQVGPFRKIARARYAFELARLPATAGSVTLTTTEAYTETETQVRVSEEIRQFSDKDDHEWTRCLDLSGADQAAGWRIVRTSVGVDVHVAEGEEGSDWYNRGQQETSDTKACWRMRTEHHTWDDDGKIIWRIRANVTRTVDRTRPKTHTDVLDWATSRTYTLPPGDWKIRIKLFDGREYELNRSELTNELVKVRATGRDVSISTFGAPGH